MTVEDPDRGLRIHALLLECASGSKSVEDAGSAIVDFARSEAAPDGPILSDLLLDTLFLYDTGVSVDDEEILSSQRERLGELVSKLIEGGCIVEQDAYGRLEAPLLHAARLIPDSKQFEKKHVRINTNLLYKQQKFNLFREDNEGYSKLIVEVETFLSTTANIASEEKSHELLNSIQSLIGYFDLDPNRVLDVLVELLSASVLTHWRFILLLLKMSPWFSSNQELSNSQHSFDGDLTSRSGNQAAAQIIGFKFQQIKHSPDDDKPLIMLAALLIKEGLLRLQDLWPHLAPDDASLIKEKSAYQNRILDEVDKAKGRNALAMAGGLDEDDTKPTDSSSGANQVAADQSSPIKEDNQQKIALLYALLSVGALRESLFVLSEFPFLLSSHSNLAQAFAIILEEIIEPLWLAIRPHSAYPSTALNSLRQFKRVPEEPKYRDSALVLPEEPELLLVLDPLSATFSNTVRHEFFYDEVNSQLDLCKSIEHFDTTVLPYIRMLGLQIHRSIKLCTKIARIGKSALLTSSTSQAVRDTWQSILRSSLLPALSLIDTNPAIVNDIFSLIKEYTTEERFSLYGEWFVDSYKKLPELKVQFVKSEKETKSLLRRISKTNTKEYGRRLAKVSHTNPCIVLNIALNQIESYDNLVDVVIEASRYFTLLTFDVLVYVMLTLLSNTQKRRLKEDGTSVAHWLQSLSSFTAKIFKRYSHMDASPIAIYVAKQLKTDNAFDLIILRDLISEMAGIRPTSDLSEDQLQGCTGGPALRVEALSLINDRRDASAKAPLRLLHAFDKTKLAIPLAILIGQQRSQCVYTVAEEQSLVKLLANLSDEVHQILIQFLEFLELNTDASTYAASIPSIQYMILQCSLEPCVAFMIARPAIAAQVHAYTASVDHKAITGDVTMKDGAETLENQITNTEENLTPMEIDSIPTIQSATAILLPHVNDLSNEISTIFAKDLWMHITPLLFTIFWSLSLYDLSVPSSRYEKAIVSLDRQVKDLDNGTPETAPIPEKTKFEEKARLKAAIESIKSEREAQEHNVSMISGVFKSGLETWFVVCHEQSEKSAFAYTFLQHCLLPRCFVSPNDATYCAQFLEKLQQNKYHNLDLMSIYETLYSSHLATSIFCSTEREAENLGRFLGQVLSNLNAVSQNQELYEASALCDVDDVKTKDQCWKEYNTAWYDSFHRSLWTNVKACFESKDYMHVRNLLIVLEKMSVAFPYFKWIGSNIEKEVDKVISSERREDLKIRALGYKAVLKRHQGRWHDVPGKQRSVTPAIQNVTETATEAAQDSIEVAEQASIALFISAKGIDEATTNAKGTDEATTKAQTSSPLNPAAPQFRPEAADSQTATPASKTTASSAELQKENARKAAASINQALRKEKPSNTQPGPDTSIGSDKPALKPPLRPVDQTVEARSHKDTSRTSSRASSPRTSRVTQPSLRESNPSTNAVSNTSRRDQPSLTGQADRNGSAADNRVTGRGREYDERRDTLAARDRRDRIDYNSRTMRAPESTTGRLNGPQSRPSNNEERREAPHNDLRNRSERSRSEQATYTESGPSRAREAPSGPRTGPVRDRQASLNIESRDGPRELVANGRPPSANDRDRSGRDEPAASLSRSNGSMRASTRDQGRTQSSNGASHSQSSEGASTSQAAPEHFIHPSRLPATPSATRSSSNREADVSSRALPASRAEPAEPVVHSSRQAIIANHEPTDRSRSASTANNDRSPRATRGAAPREPLARAEPSDSRAARDRRPPRDLDSRITRDERQDDPRDARGADMRSIRGERDARSSARPDTRRLSERVPRKEQHDTKRRHISDSRDSQRPAKRRF